jgi:hypothetical protein
VRCLASRYLRDCAWHSDDGHYAGRCDGVGTILHSPLCDITNIRRNLWQLLGKRAAAPIWESFVPALWLPPYNMSPSRSQVLMRPAVCWMPDEYRQQDLPSIGTDGGEEAAGPADPQRGRDQQQRHG